MTAPRAILLAAIISLICGLACANALIAIWRFNQPLTTVTRQVQDIWYSPGGRHDPEGARFTLASGTAWRWNCEFRNCEHPAAELKAQRWETPLPVTFVLAGPDIVGVTIKGVEIVSPEHDLPAHRAAAAVHAVGWGAAGLVSGLLAFLAWRVRSKFQAGRYRLDAQPIRPRFRSSQP